MKPALRPLNAAAMGLALAMAGSAVLAQQAQPAVADPVGDLMRSKGEQYRRAPDSVQTPEELRLTQALNAEIAAQNDLAENQDRANAATFAEAQAGYQADLEKAAQERSRHEADMRSHADSQARYERQMADWRATVAACEAGDRVRCEVGQQAPLPR